MWIKPRPGTTNEVNKYNGSMVHNDLVRFHGAMQANTWSEKKTDMKQAYGPEGHPGPLKYPILIVPSLKSLHVRSNRVSHIFLPLKTRNPPKSIQHLDLLFS